MLYQLLMSSHGNSAASKMASLLGEHLFQISGQGPPPQKDFFQLLITNIEVIWRTWTISIRLECQGATPTELKVSHDNFLLQKMLQQNVEAVFGQRILEYTRSLCQGQFDYLERLPNGMVLKILSFLQLTDVTRLAQVSHRFRQICDSEKFWEQTVRNRCDDFTSDMEGIANVMGWRKIFFTFFHTSVHEENHEAIGELDSQH
ncbi:F-box only protein 36a [Gasterosteus aculeatus]|uniref:F-box protein 36a n=1 Tax=Gasterosteus aculeatus aculeatus TaxID=481459 RepID=A0AAQ4RTU9_GASAC|nr:F-box only protein 36a [Gasterosteus aculeatus aculeatus]